MPFKSSPNATCLEADALLPSFDFLLSHAKGDVMPSFDFLLSHAKGDVMPSA